MDVSRFSNGSLGKLEKYIGRIEYVEAPGSKGVPNNTASRDASAIECHRIYE